MTIDERIEALEKEVAALVYAASPQAALDRLKAAFPGEGVTKETDADDQASPPAVVSFIARKLAWIKDRGWFVIWIADNATVIAPIKKATRSMIWGACEPVKAGEYIYGANKVLPTGYEVMEIVRNPYLPEDFGCCG